MKGVYLKDIKDFNSKYLQVHITENGSYILSYKGDTRIAIKSGVFMGEIATYDSKYSSSILVKRGELLDQIREKVESLLGKNKSLNFYSKKDSACTAFFAENLSNMQKERCLNICHNGEAKLMTLSELGSMNKPVCWTVVLKSGKIVCKEGSKFNWKLQIVEGHISDIPKDFEGWLKTCEVPKLRYF